ncbi:hypothetical protein CRM22_005079 [Opisthorchis felineus]|uniref:Dynein light chain n=5 Tax=Opisthorchiidae TaxID=6196 RepID=G7YW12_CLOSI|nr:hypothetical protein T265_01479 [Opisthorchis viverrini]KAG5454023.1 Dynein light chain Tctex-type [Clonorchis sinensis]TGZ66913.1 hypothetical protein CRM22_005079 [Opisthorchis felineus]KER32424.1 hypothetical protein T265_01479 [Opisthorchis viverrini]OON23249.1 dynein light chain type 1 [Opisthorchis viverrini]GAA57142.1 dynein light chain 1 cytoplasmic [Clonorchis sinensis]
MLQESNQKEYLQSDMNGQMRRTVLELCGEAFRLFRVEKDIASYVREGMRTQYPGIWHCIVGEKFGSAVSYESNTFINFYFDRYGILLFKAG